MLSMYDLRKIARGEPLNEFVISFPSTKDEVKKMDKSEDNEVPNIRYIIKIRTQFGSDASNDGKRVSHECALKVYTNTKQEIINIPIPTKPYQTLKPNSIYVNRLKLLDDLNINQNAKIAIKSFIYQHQMELVAYWYLSQEEMLLLDDAFRKYFKNLLRTNNYSRSPYKRDSGKTAAELEQDKKEILKYVKSEVPSYSGSLYFGA